MAGQLQDGFALFSGIIAGLGLWSWLGGIPDLLAFGSAFVPMAPSTALVMMAASLAVFLLHRWPQDRNVIRFAWWAAGFTLFVGLWVTIRPWFGWGSPLEEWLSSTTRQVGHIPAGQMSPLTGGTFLAVALALLFRLLSASRFPRARGLAWAVALAVAVMGLVMAGGYAMGKPWLYGGSLIPMALWTALAFACLGFSLLGLAAVETSLEEAAGVARGRILSLAQLAVVSLLILLICLVSALHLRHSLVDDWEDASELLTAIGDLRAGEIVKWQQRRLLEAESLTRASLVGQQLQRFLENPADAAARNQAESLLALIEARDRYAAVAFFDTHSVLRLASSETFEFQSAGVRQLVADVSRSNSVALSDLHRPAGAREIHLDIACPVFVPAASLAAGPATAPAGNAGAVLGVLVLRIDAGQFLFPLIQTWPTPSLTAETLLVRREGDEVLFLNELRHQRGTALNLRLPIAQHPGLPAAEAALGRTGVMEGADYRGVPVLAAVRAVPRSPWFLVAKVDRDEIYAHLYEQAWLTLALTVVLAAAVGMLVNLAGQRRKVADMHRELALAQRVEYLMESANDMIFLADEHWRLLEVNTRAIEVYGYTPAEFRDLSLADLRTEEARARYDQDIAQLLAAGHAVFETLHRRKDGSVFPVESSIRVIDIAGVSYRLAILRDITVRKAQEREIQRLNRLYHTLSEINQSIVRIQSREELFQRVCQIAAEFSGFKAVWLGWLDPETHEVRPVGCAGAEQSYLDGLEFYADDRPAGQGAVGTCIREGRACVIQDLARDPRAAHRREIAAAHGLRSAAAVPIRLEGKVCGAFTVYADEPDIFREKEVALLEETALDISFALDTLAKDARRRQAEEGLRESEERLRLATEAARMGTWERDLKTSRLAWSPMAEQLNGYEPGTFPGTEEAFRELLHPDCLADYTAARRRVREGNGIYRAELRFRLRDGRERWGLVVGRLIRGEDGQPERIVGIDLDITERKAAEEKLAAQLRELQRWHDATLGREGRILELKRQVNELLARAGEPLRYSSTAPTADGDEPVI